MTVDEFTRAAMALSSDERADLAAELLSSLEPTDPVTIEEHDDAWAVEHRRRADEVLSGEVAGDELGAILDRTRTRLRGR